MKLGSAKAWAKTLGSGLAQVQHGIDKLAAWGFEKLKEAGTEPKKKQKIQNTYVRGAAHAVKGTLSFLGQLGQNYYNSYEKLKKRS